MKQHSAEASTIRGREVRSKADGISVGVTRTAAAGKEVGGSVAIFGSRFDRASAAADNDIVGC